jgi:alkanesulfonate monooxygenase SsuD/methylene tetrahydromethanopterin reductase-like flavin-dependent oxidoreductase (luciferase family)
MSDDTTQAAKRLAEMFERPGVNLTLHGIDVSATIHSLVARAEKAEAERDRLREALIEWRDEPPGGISKGGVLYLSPERVAAQVEAARREGAAKEREAIAQMHDIWADRHHPDTIAHTRHKFCAAAIRARGDA